jgi:hypothetical protein
VFLDILERGPKGLWLRESFRIVGKVRDMNWKLGKNILKKLSFPYCYISSYGKYKQG